MSQPAIAVLHSPLVGPISVEPLADALAARGWQVELPTLVGVLDAEDAGRADVIDRFVTRLGHIEQPLVLLAHSGAGHVVGEVAAQVPSTAMVIFIDGDLPVPGESWVDHAPDELADSLHSQVDNGRLPPWSEWFPEAALPDLGPLPRMPWSYLTEPAAADQWHGPWAYIRLTDAYPSSVARAESVGAPVARLDTDHLAPFTHPQVVADATEELIRSTLR